MGHHRDSSRRRYMLQRPSGIIFIKLSCNLKNNSALLQISVLEGGYGSRKTASTGGPRTCGVKVFILSLETFHSVNIRFLVSG